MGNSNNLAYDIEEPVDYRSALWSLHNGSKKEPDETGKKLKVAVFRFLKSNADRLPAAQRNVQKLRTLRHPYILTYLDSTELEDSLLLVTEAACPLDLWISRVLAGDPALGLPKASVASELTWGFKCILNAMSFLHAQANLVHGNLHPGAIFITSSGDWKLSSLELAANPSNAEDQQHVSRFKSLQSVEFAGSSSSSSSAESSMPADVLSLGKVMQYVFNKCDESLGDLSKYVKLMLGDTLRRPQLPKLLTLPVFNSPYIQCMENIAELSIKSKTEMLDTLNHLSPLLPAMPSVLCVAKLLPQLMSVLTIAIADFQSRDLRENSRSLIMQVLALINTMVEQNKLPGFTAQQLDTFATLFLLSDRSIRTALLSALKYIGGLLPAEFVNKHVFNQILAGFADSNAKMRESTLMSLIYIIDKLDEKHLQDRLVRAVTNLQADPEASIRTNTIIFLGKISGKLSKAVQQRVLVNALVKSMKDPFAHCRLAGMKTAMAIHKMLDLPQIAGKLIPQASVLLLDKVPEIRALAVTCILSCVSMMKSYHEELLVMGDKEKDAKEEPVSSSSDYLGSSWSLFTKTFESATTPAHTPAKQQAIEQQQQQPVEVQTPVAASVSASASKTFEDDDMNLNSNFNFNPSGNNSSKMMPDSTSNWDDDLDDALNLDDLSVSTHSSIAPPAAVPDTPPAVKMSSKAAPKPAAAAAAKAKPVKVAVKKLEVKAEDNWEDF